MKMEATSIITQFENIVNIINQFLSKCADETSGVSKDEIYSMDETTIYLDSPSNKKI